MKLLFVVQLLFHGNKTFPHNARINCRSARFAELYEADRLYWKRYSHELETIFPQSDMEYLDCLLRSSRYHKPYTPIKPQNPDFLHKRFRSIGPVDKIDSHRPAEKWLRPNRQFTYAVFQGSYSDAAMLIDINNREVSFPFISPIGSDWLGQSLFEWNRAGKRIAYSARKAQVGSHSILVVKDVSKNDPLSRVDMDLKSIVDTTWSPNDQYVAVLSVKASLSYNPIKLLFTLGGHPIGYRTYYVDIYDMAGTLMYQSKNDDIGTFDTGGVGILATSIVWLEKDAELRKSTTEDEKNSL